ncbi:hypothetical protein Y032_0521g2873 [Ancylostoma ceylanicum]|uniref:Miro-like protein n=1 Tax=Ancylostoma ceylanicum TaxID=53326 RepID=A0A016WSB4_9BILA|nr:hypothetical protein Y032_0521g2873 [Ancylostoma ceylanicum]
MTIVDLLKSPLILEIFNVSKNVRVFPQDESSGFLSPDMRQPLRSQSFKHRPRPLIEVKKSAIEDVPSERRRSTPTISRRCSLVHRRVQEPRTDVWPEAKPASEFEEKFLRLPAAEEYKRVRQFKIDAKGAVVSRGDSFRRKKNETTVKNDKSPSPYPISGSDSARESRSESVSSSEESRREAATATVDDPSTSHRAYKIYVVGDTGTGKSSLIGQLITSEYKNAFADEIQDYENTVSISLGGQELDLIFFESDMADATWLTDEVDGFVVIYSIDSRRSWKQATMAIEMIRDSTTCRNSPIVVAGNKADLERKRTVTKNEVRTASAHFGFEPLEISVALDHDVDDLLVSLVAELKEAYAPDTSSIEKPSPRIEDDFHAAIRRYSQRKKKALPEDINTGLKQNPEVTLMRAQRFPFREAVKTYAATQPHRTRMLLKSFLQRRRIG